jgi:hypothetical protein
MKNEKQVNPPLIDRILIIGTDEEEFTGSLSTNRKELNTNNPDIKILEDYKSKNLKECSNENYIENIPSVI